MIALENLKQVNYKNSHQKTLGSVKNWNWVPNVCDLKKVERVFEATMQTSRQTNSSQTDHGEGW